MADRLNRMAKQTLGNCAYPNGKERNNCLLDLLYLFFSLLHCLVFNILWLVFNPIQQTDLKCTDRSHCLLIWRLDWWSIYLYMSTQMSVSLFFFPLSMYLYFFFYSNAGHIRHCCFQSHLDGPQVLFLS